MPIRSGKLKTKVVVEVRSSAKDEYGAKLNLYTKVYMTRANVRYLASSDLIKSGVATNIEVITVLMRYDARIKHSHFLSTKGHRFDVTGIKPSENGREIIVTATREL